MLQGLPMHPMGVRCFFWHTLEHGLLLLNIACSGHLVAFVRRPFPSPLHSYSTKFPANPNPDLEVLLKLWKHPSPSVQPLPPRLSVLCIAAVLLVIVGQAQLDNSLPVEPSSGTDIEDLALRLGRDGST